MAGGGCRGAAIIFVNGNVVGVHQRSRRFAAALRRLRRCGRIGAHTSVHVDQVPTPALRAAWRAATDEAAPPAVARCRAALMCDRGSGRGAMGGTARSLQDTVNIACDGGRVCRPLIICDRGRPRVTQAHMQVLCYTSSACACSIPFWTLSASALMHCLPDSGS